MNRVTIVASVLAMVLFAAALLFFPRTHLRTQSTPATAMQNIFEEGTSSASATSTLSFGSGGDAVGVASGGQRTPPAGEKEYQNATYGFSLFYPETLSVKEYHDSTGAETITFQDPATVQGFEVFATPYTDSKITPARFAEDEPSGVRKNVAAGAVDGAPAAAFNGFNLRLGDTYEVWILHDGNLFEVSTLAPLQSALASVLSTWRFE